MTSTTTSTHRTRRMLGSTAGAIAVVVGSIAALSSLALLVLFGPSGTLSTGTYPVATPTSALVADAGTVTGTTGATRVIGAATVHLSATADSTPVFVGIGPAADVDRYLTGVATDKVDAFTGGVFGLRLDRHPGTVSPAPPAEQRFWTTSASSSSTADLTWRVQDGTYRLVVMHADGTPGVTTQVRAAVTVPNMFGISLGVLLGGLGLTGAGIAMLVVANRARPTTA